LFFVDSFDDVAVAILVALANVIAVAIFYAGSILAIFVEL
jgi:hypothetical protein